MILTGQGKPENSAADARHVFEAQKYGSYFITTDARILKRAEELQAACDINIVLPREFLALVRDNAKPKRR